MSLTQKIWNNIHSWYEREFISTTISMLQYRSDKPFYLSSLYIPFIYPQPSCHNPHPFMSMLFPAQCGLSLGMCGQLEEQLHCPAEESLKQNGWVETMLLSLKTAFFAPLYIEALSTNSPLISINVGCLRVKLWGLGNIWTSKAETF